MSTRLALFGKKAVLAFVARTLHYDNMKEKEYQNIEIKDLYPELTEEQLKKSEENLERYLEVVLRIYERIRDNPDDLHKLRNLTRRK